jgi:2-oxoglutarate dehydrogenase E1 component
VAICRVEQLYPVPVEELRAVIAGYPRLREVVWVQEEPQNMGAWEFIRPALADLLGGREPEYIGRPRSSSPAEGSASRHARRQAMIIEQALQAGSPRAAGEPSLALSKEG